MKKIWTPELLTEFEAKVAEKFNLGEIRAPIHLSDGTEDELINIFRDVKDEDWIFCSWRSHYQCLLKGVHQAEDPVGLVGIGGPDLLAVDQIVVALVLGAGL